MEINEVYLPLFAPASLSSPCTRYNVLKGGAGAGKSRAIAQYIIYCLTSRAAFKVLAMHKIATRIEATVYAELKTVIQTAGLTSQFTFTTSPFKIRHQSGNEIIFMGLDDPDKIKSISGINLIWMEEADMFSQDDFNQADTRLRGECEWKHQLFLSFNPTSELSWLKSTFFDDDYGDTLVLESTFRDNAFLDADYVKALERKGKSDPNFLRVYMNGEWGRISTDGLFYKQFDSFKHCADGVAIYDDSLPLWLSFDFNVQPYCACTIWQLQDEKTLALVDEITLPSPRNTTKYVCQEFKRRYPHHIAGLFVTGDPAGKHNDTRSEKGFNDYTIITQELAGYHPSLRVDSKAPGIVPRGNFINAILCEDLATGRGWNELKIIIHSKCKKTIEDLTYQKETNGGKDKSKARNKDGMMVEKYGHCSDTLDYLLCKVWAKDFDEFLRGPKKLTYMVGKKQTSSRFSL